MDPRLYGLIVTLWGDEFTSTYKSQPTISIFTEWFDLSGFST